MRSTGMRGPVDHVARSPRRWHRALVLGAALSLAMSAAASAESTTWSSPEPTAAPAPPPTARPDVVTAPPTTASPVTGAPTTAAPPTTTSPGAASPSKVGGPPGGSGALSPAAAVANNADGRLEAVWRDDTKIMHAYQLWPNGAWSAAAELTSAVPSTLTGNPLIVLDARGLLSVVVDTTAGTYLATQVVPNSYWSDWGLLGPDLHRPVLGRFTGPGICVDFIDYTGYCYQDFGAVAVYYAQPTVSSGLQYQQQNYPGGAWSQPFTWNVDPYQGQGPLQMVLFNDEQFELYYPNIALHDWVAITGPGKSYVCQLPTIPANQCIELGTPPGGFDANAGLAAGVNDDGRAEVYAYGADKGVWHIYQMWDGSWTGWEPMFRPYTSASLVGSPQVQRNRSGSLEIVMAMDDGTIWHAFQHVPNGAWSGWHSLGASGFNGSLAVALAINEDGRLEEFNVKPGPAAKVTHAYQHAPSTGPWSSIIPL